MGIFCCTICGTLCFNTARTKSLEIFLITLNAIAFLFLFISLIVIKWKELSSANVVFFVLMLLISVCCLIFAILLRIWRYKNLIKTFKKKAGTNLSIAGMVLVIINFIFCLIEEIIYIISSYRANHPCYKNKSSKTYEYYYYRRMSSVDCTNQSSGYYIEIITFGQDFMAYATFSYLEICLIFGMILWSLLRTRIKAELDGPPQIPAISPHMVDPYGRAVVVVQPGDVVMMGGNPYQYNPYAQNPQNQHIPNQYPGSSDQIEEKIA